MDLSGKEPGLAVKHLSRKILEQMLAHSSEGIIVAAANDPDFPVVYVNPAYERLSGTSADELRGRGLPLLSGGNLDETETERLKAALTRGDPYVTHLAGRHEDGTDSVNQIRVESLYGPRGEVVYIMVSQTPVSTARGGSSGVEVGVLQREVRRVRQKLTSTDRLDSGTGMFQYEYFLELAKRDFMMARRDKRLVAVVLFDVVDLDAYGQTFGSKAADSCLRKVAVQISRALRRSGDLCARADGHTIIALTHGQGIDEVRALAARIAANVRGLALHNPRGSYGRYVAVQVGVAGRIPDKAYTAEVAIEAAHDDLQSLQPAQKARYGASA
jgi:diguanylate cyclase (GGDEF)-like protein/PAS domain S-box-containing protein